MHTTIMTFLEEGDEVWLKPSPDSAAALRYQVVRHRLLLVGSDEWNKEVVFLKRQREREQVDLSEKLGRPIKDQPQA